MLLEESFPLSQGQQGLAVALSHNPELEAAGPGFGFTFTLTSPSQHHRIH